MIFTTHFLYYRYAWAMMVRGSLLGLLLWLLFLFAAASLLPGQVFVLDVLDGIVKTDELLFFSLLFQ